MIISSCTATGEKAQMESNTQAVADSILNSAPADSGGAPKELSPSGEEQH
jgi:hypothetical protein